MELKQMTAIDEKLLQRISCGLLLLDADNRVEWVNDVMASKLGMQPAEVLGNTLAGLPETAQHLLSAEPRLLQLPSGQGWVSREVHSNDDGQRLFVIFDITTEEQLAEDNARLRQQVEDLRLTDELTGLPNKRAISQALELHISRSRRYQNPLSVVMVYVDMQALARVRPMSTDPIVLAVSRFLRDRLRWVDQIARWDDNVFVLVLPETTEADAKALLDKITHEQDAMNLPDSYVDLAPKLGFGLACWKKGDDIRTLLRSALDDLREGSGV
jgi:diguanylate cyclase (GGDEF)-like protein